MTDPQGPQDPQGQLPEPLQLFRDQANNTRDHDVLRVLLASEATDAEARADAEDRGEVPPMPGQRPRRTRAKAAAGADPGLPAAAAAAFWGTPGSAPAGSAIAWRSLAAVLCTLLGVFALGAVVGAALTGWLGWELIASVGVMVGFAGYMCGIFLRPLYSIERRR